MGGIRTELEPPILPDMRQLQGTESRFGVYRLLVVVLRSLTEQEDHDENR
jgi:hypothetical protein